MIASQSICRDRSRERYTTTMNNATNTTQPPVKRTRFEPRNKTDATKTSPPKHTALQFIKNSIASLHQTIAHICEHLGKEHIVLLGQLDNKQQKLKQMQNDASFIPNSARINFEHSVTKRAAKSAEYDALKEQTSEYIIEARKDLKALIIAAVKIEIQYLHIEIQEHLVTSLRIITETFMTNNRDTSDIDVKAKLIIEHYHARLSIHAPMSKKDFIILYNTINPNDTPATTADDDMNEDDAIDGSLYEQITGNALTIRRRDVIDPSIAALGLETTVDTFETVFVSAWTQYKQQKEMNTVTVELKKLSTRVLTTRTTAAAVAAIDNEPAADKVELQALINHVTKSDNKELQQQLDKLKKELDHLKSAKNIFQRGRGGASKKQPNTPS